MVPPSAVTCSSVGYFTGCDNSFGPCLVLVKVLHSKTAGGTLTSF